MKLLLCALALSFGVAYADIPAILTNQTYDNAAINAGTYFNTAGAETKFINSAGTGITLNTGNNIRGAEVFNGAVTGNGGNIHIQAPDQVVRLNGNIDVRGFLANGTNQLGNGGKVTVDAAYLYQNGNIYAPGYQGGNVTMNVGGMTMASNTLIDAHSTSTELQQPGGSVVINSTGSVDLQRGAKVDVSGANFWFKITRNGDFSTGEIIPGYSNISISGSAVNIDGILQASEAILTNGPASSGTEGGGISLVATNGDVTIGKNAILQADSANGMFNGRTITVTASNDINQNGLVLVNGSKGEHIYKSSILIANIQKDLHNGGSGGTIDFSASHDINQNGRITADGGNGPVGYSGGAGGIMTFTAGNIMA